MRHDYIQQEEQQKKWVLCVCSQQCSVCVSFAVGIIVYGTGLQRCKLILHTLVAQVRLLCMEIVLQT